MGRAKNDSGVLSGKERIKMAFWELYQKKTLDNIGVKEIAALARCNRTTFYYHYENIDAVLEEIEAEVILTGAPQALVIIMQTDGGLQDLNPIIEENGEKIHKICHLLSSKGDPAFAGKLKKAMLEEWRKALGCEAEELPIEKKLLLEFFMGGSLSLMGSLREDSEYSIEEVIKTLFQLLSQDLFKAIKNLILK